MISPRKRKLMLRNLNTFFQRHGRIISEHEYRNAAGTPYRLDQIQRYLHGWVRMTQALCRYYPKWREGYVEQEVPNVEEEKEDLVARMKAAAKARKAETATDE